MPWKECHVMDERLRFVARLLEGEKMAPLCAEFGISRVLQMIEHDPAGKPHKPTAYVFGDKIGQQVKDPKKAWLKCCADADIGGLHFHDLRHEAGSRML